MVMFGTLPFSFISKCQWLIPHKCGLQLLLAQPYISLPDPHDLPFLMEQFQPVADIWRLLGVTLGLTLVELDEIEGMPLLIPGGPAAFLQEMLNKWLKRAPPSHPFPTLTMLCDALRGGGTAEERRVAHNLEQHYLVQKTGLSVCKAPMNT